MANACTQGPGWQPLTECLDGASTLLVLLPGHVTVILVLRMEKLRLKEVKPFLSVPQ